MSLHYIDSKADFGVMRLISRKYGFEINGQKQADLALLTTPPTRLNNTVI